MDHHEKGSAPVFEEMALVGRIARTHGLRGQVIVNLETDFPEIRFQPGTELFVEHRGVVHALMLTTVRFQNGRPVIGIAGVDTLEAAEELPGCELRVPLGRLPELPAGTFYRHDLIGCQVDTREGVRVGVVGDVNGTAAGTHLVVQAAEGEILIPLASEICRTIDVVGKRIVIEPPDGLLDLNA